MSGAEFDARVRCVGKDMANRFSSDKQTPNKSKFSSSGADAPEIGASYIVRRHDDARRKLLTFGKMRRAGAGQNIVSGSLLVPGTLTLTLKLTAKTNTNPKA